MAEKIDLIQIPQLTIAWTKDALTHRPIQFSGRAGRSEYWCFTLAILVASLIAAAAIGVIGAYTKVGDFALLALNAVVSAALILPAIPIGARRLHDINRSGWYLLLWLVPLIGWAVLIYFTLLEGENGENRYGEPAPKMPN